MVRITITLITQMWKKTKVNMKIKFKNNTNIILMIIMFKKIFYTCMVEKKFLLHSRAKVSSRALDASELVSG